MKKGIKISIISIVLTLSILILLSVSLIVVIKIQFNAYTISPEVCKFLFRMTPEEFCEQDGEKYFNTSGTEYTYAKVDDEGNLFFVLTNQQKKDYLDHVSVNINATKYMREMYISNGKEFIENNVNSELNALDYWDIVWGEGHLERSFEERAYYLEEGAKVCGIEVSEDYTQVIISPDDCTLYSNLPRYGCIYIQVFLENKGPNDVKAEIVYLDEYGEVTRTHTYPN